MQTFTDEDVANLKALGEPQAAPIEGGGIASRIGKQAANLLPNTANAFQRDILSMLLPQGASDVAEVPKFYDLPAPQTTGERAVDFLGAGVAPKLAEFLLPYGAIGRVARAAELPTAAAEAIAQGGASAFTSAEEGPKVAATQALLGAGLGSLGGLTRAKRLLPAATLAAAGAGINIAEGADPKIAILQNLAASAGAMIPAKFDPVALAKPAIAREILPSESAPLVHPEPATPPLYFGEKQDPGVLLGKDLAAQEQERIRLEMARGGPLASIKAPELLQAGEAAAQTPEAFYEKPLVRGKFQIPEYQRTEGGSADLGLLNQIGQPLAGGLIGATQGDTTEERIRNAILGAGIGAVTGHATRTLLENPRLFSSETGGIANPFKKGLPTGFELTSKVNKEDDVAISLLKFQGKKIGHIVGSKWNDAIHISDTDLEKNFHKQGFGIAMYDSLMDLAKEKNLKVFSDYSVSNEAANVYESLAKRGYDIVKNPKAKWIVDEEGNGHWATSDRQGPVFEIRQPEKSIAILQNDPESVAQRYSLRYEGMQDKLHLFTDTEHGGSTISLPLGEGQVAVETKLAQSRAALAEPQISVDNAIKQAQDKPKEKIFKTKKDALSAVDELQHQEIPAGVQGSGKDWRIVAHGYTNSKNTRIIYYLGEDNKLYEYSRKDLNPEMKFKGNVSGAISNHALFTIAGGTAGGLYGYKESGGDWNKAAAYATLGAGAGALGYLALEALARKTPAAEAKTPIVGAAKDAVQAAKNIVATGMKDAGGNDVRGRGGVVEKMVRGMEIWGRFHMPDDLKTILTRANGTIDAIADSVNQALKGIQNSRPTDDLIEIGKKYLKGQLTPEANVKALISSEGGVLHEQWKVVPKKDRPDFGIWKVGDDIYRVSSDTRAKLVAMEDSAIQDATKDNLQYGKFLLAGRKATNAAQDMWARAFPDGNIKEMLIGSQDQYQTRGYEIFTNKSFWPKEENIKKVMDELSLNIDDSYIQKAVQNADAYLQEDFDSRVTKLGGRKDEESVKRLQQIQKFVPIEHQGQKFMVHQDVAEGYHGQHNDQFLRNQVEQYLHETKSNKAFYKLGAGERGGVDMTLLKEREQLSPTFRELIGEFTDPVETVAHTLNRLLPSARAAAAISEIEGLKINDLPAAVDQEGWVRQSNELQGSLQEAQRQGNQERIAILQSQIKELNSYMKLPSNSSIGLLKDLHVSRFVYDQFKDYTGGWGDMTNPIARGMAATNNFAKMVHSPYNPISQIRNAVQIPIFAAISKASISSMRQAHAALISKTGPIWDEALREGIVSGTHLQGELKYGVEKIVGGSHDSEISKAFKATHNAILTAYQYPDAIVRIGAYLEAKSRYASKLGKATNDPEVIAKAVQFTDRYTMNYGNVAPFVKVARQIPLFNLYVSYAAEIARIGKNLVEDAIGKGDKENQVFAMGMLGLLAGSPEVIQAVSEANLSPEDKKKWNQAQKEAPDYSRTRFKFLAGKDEKGNFHYIDFTPIIIQDNYAQTMRAIKNGDVGSLVAVNPILGWQNTPAWNIVASQVAGKNLHNQRDFRGFNDRIESIASEILPSITPGIGYEYQKLANIGITNQKTGRTESVAGALLRWTTGTTTTSVNPAIVHSQAVRGMISHIDNERQYLNDILKTTAPQEQKNRAIARFKDSVKTILAVHSRDSSLQ